ncbi:MAG: hypothetical protein PHP54_04170 [Clostridia bacterium]|nr:hypothetical protein [Clostridia bacterium]
MYITRNGLNDLVVLSDKAFETITNHHDETKEERINRLISEKFNKHYENKEPIIAKI